MKENYIPSWFHMLETRFVQPGINHPSSIIRQEDLKWEAQLIELTETAFLLPAFDFGRATVDPLLRCIPRRASPWAELRRDAIEASPEPRGPEGADFSFCWEVNLDAEQRRLRGGDGHGDGEGELLCSRSLDSSIGVACRFPRFPSDITCYSMV